MTAPSSPSEPSTAVSGAFAAEPIGATLGRVRLGVRSIAEEVAAAADRAARHGAPASAQFADEPVDVGGIDPVWIDRFDQGALESGVGIAAAAGPHAPLAGVPVAVKGNIDVAGLPTTAACPSFADGVAGQHAAAVQRLVDAGAVVVGTTNLDQFATGLNGTRSPYGAPHAVGLPGRISGGSSSGSAVAVARGDVPLALGTDTAGSGRVPAALNGIVGLKPSKGLVSAAGVLPACRSLDVVSIFAADIDSATLALSVLAGPDAADAWSRTGGEFVGAEGSPLAAALPPASGPGRVLRIGVPAALPDTKIDPEAAAAWEAALALLPRLAGEVELVEVDLAPFLEAGAMLYGSAFVAERYASVGAFIKAAVAADPEDPALDPTVRDLVLAGAAPSAAEAFAAIDRIRALTAQAHAVLAGVDALLTPTVLEHPTHDELAADPVGANARLGLFTTFGNLLDLAVVALPAAPRSDGLPFGVSLHAPAFCEARVLELGARFERAACESQGAPRAAGAPPATDAEGRVLLAVGGAHMAGMPINHELTSEGGEYVRLTRTSSDYRLHVLETPLGPRPGIERIGAGGAGGADLHPSAFGAFPGGAAGPGVEVEVWAIPSERLGAFIHRVPPQLALGPITLFDGSTVLGFLAAASDEVASARLVPSWRHFARGG
jgi:allophanate hydrolase